MEQHLSQYYIFYEVAKLGNISKAAKALYISQPAISKAISKLEDGLEITLFTRNSRGVVLTVEGQLLFDHISEAFKEIDMGEQQIKRAKELHMGNIKIGVSNTLCRYILLPYLQKFIEKYPHVKISVESQDTARTVHMLENNLLDLGLIAAPSNRKSLSFTPLLEIHDTFVATPSYLSRLYEREGLSCDPLVSGTVILLDKTNMTRKYIDDYLEGNLIEPSNILEVTTMDLVIEFAKIGLGIGSVIKEVVQKELTEGSLVEIELKSELRSRNIGFSYSSANKNPTLLSFLNCK